MTYVLALAIVLFLAFIAWQQLAFRGEREAERAEFAAERKQWAAERRDLNNRIQIPEAAPFMEDDDSDQPTDDDLPTLPGGAINEEELDRAREALAEVGYDEGPVA